METRNTANTFRELKSLLALHGISFADVARSGGFSPISTRVAIYRHWGKSLRVKGIETAAILAKTKEIVEQLNTKDTNHEKIKGNQ